MSLLKRKKKVNLQIIVLKTENILKLKQKLPTNKSKKYNIYYEIYET